MWSLKPLISPPSTCPGCQERNPGFKECLITGVHILGKGECSACGLVYYHNWPIGHGVQFPISFDGNGITRYSHKAEQWLAVPLIKAIKEDLRIEGSIRRIVRKSFNEGLLLNCLDPCYGHVLWKLFNVSFYRDTETPQGLIVLIPENCLWLVPDYVAEIWSVQVPLSELKYRVADLDRFIKNISQGFQKLKLLPAYTHVDHASLSLQEFLPFTSFKLEEYYQLPATISIVWRSDRYWLRWSPDYWLSLVVAKYQISWIRAWLLYLQRKKMINLINRIRKEFPKVQIKVTGIGTTGSFPSYVEDLRCDKPDQAQEKIWCQCYAQSQLVIGVHGSNMLLPTALSAGFIELLPRAKIPFLAEDILMRHPPRLQTFLGRHLDLFTSTRVITRHVVSMLKDFKYLYQNTLSRP